VNLTDKEILELNDLCNAVVDETLNDAQRARLAQWLAASAEARGYYVRSLGLSASLHHYAAEMHAEAPDAAPRRLAPAAFWWWGGALTAAAVVALMIWLATAGRPMTPSARPGGDEHVAWLTGAKDARWPAAAGPVRPGDRLHRGQRVELAAGFAEITFDSGARVVLEGPAALEIGSAWDTTLQHGTLKASVPAEALGFRIVNAAVEVVDLGTEFSMTADAGGTAEVLVLRGEVEAAPRGAAEAETILLRTNEGRRFARTGVTEVRDSAVKLARFNRPVPLDRFAPAVNYAHWSFNEGSGAALRGQRIGMVGGVLGARVHGVTPDESTVILIDGRWQQALRFDGRRAVEVPFPGISGNTPRTVACWVRVPADAQLSDAYSMIAWRAGTAKLAFRPVHIGWNRNPTEGALGALRTDFAGGCALGTTPLRDGRWHHVAVVFVPDTAPAAPVQVKQYLDGRLESSAIVPGRTRGPAGTPESALTDTLWLGCRLGNDRPRQDRFRGDLDELFVADRALDPHEIVALMRTNAPAIRPASVVARR
jgi:ferric-dicitrate binding protein FerR (iron transport regulator)